MGLFSLFKKREVQRKKLVDLDFILDDEYWSYVPSDINKDSFMILVLDHTLEDEQKYVHKLSYLMSQISEIKVKAKSYLKQEKVLGVDEVYSLVINSCIPLNDFILEMTSSDAEDIYMINFINGEPISIDMDS